MGDAITKISTADQARDLAGLLRDPQRKRPVAVVTIPAGRDASHINADEIQSEIGDVVDVYLMATGDVSWEFSSRMVDMTQVYGGAGRVYPVGLEWESDPYKSPLRFAFNTSEGRQSTEALISDGIKCASDAGLLGSTVSTVAQVVDGEVTSLIAGRALVRLSGGGFANVVGELVVPGVPIDRILRPGQRVRGTLDDARRLDIRGMVRTRADLTYEIGDVILARVASVSAVSAKLEILPGLLIEVTRDEVTTNDLDELDTLMTVDEVLRARLFGKGPWALWLRDIDDDEEAVPAMAIIDGGPPWLVEGLPEVEIEELEQKPEPPPVVAPVTVEAPRESAVSPRPSPAMFDKKRQARAQSRSAAPAIPSSPTRLGPVPATQPLELAQVQADLNRALAEIAGLRSEVKGLRDEARLLDEQRIAARNDARRAREELAQSRKKLRGRAESFIEPGRWFLDDERQFRYEVDLAWAQKIPAAQKAELPLREYILGAEFLETLNDLQGISRQKVVEVVVEVLTGLAETSGSRELHKLRTNSTGNAPTVTRDDGASCWRTSLQVKTPSARRLHFWRRTDGTVELSRVAVHDDFTP